MVHNQQGLGAALLVLEDGTYFWGRAAGAPGETFGELVFNTGMTGYQEVLTDPSYRGQIVVMTYPEVGIYGVNSEDIESDALQVAGFVVHRAVPSSRCRPRPPSTPPHAERPGTTPDIPTTHTTDDDDETYP